MSNDDQFSAYYTDEIEWSYDCPDRIVINGMFMLGQTPGGFRSWWRSFDPQERRLNDKGMQSMAGDFSRRVTSFANQNEVPLICCRGGERKDEIAEPFVIEARASGQPGIFLILTGSAPAPIWKIRVSSKGTICDIHREKPWPFVKHYFFHIMDPDWGHLIIRICGYPPYGVQVILNGHEWVECQLRRQKHDVRTDGNCFIGNADMSRAIHLWCNRLMKQEAADSIENLCKAWVYGAILPFAMHSVQLEDSRFSYDWRIFQIEYSRNFIFKSGRFMGEMFQAMIDRSRNKYDLKQVKTIFGVRGRPHKRLRNANEPRGRRDAAFKEVSKPEFDLTVFKLHWKLSTLKLYDKSARLLRAEAVEHNLKKSRHRGYLCNWAEIIDESRDKLVRFLNAGHLLDHGLVDAGRLDFWHMPTQRGKQRLAGIDITNARMQFVIHALASLALVTDGFTRKDLAAQVNSIMPGKQTCTLRQISYDMSKLRGKGAIMQIPKSRKNKVNLRKLRPLLTLVTLREKIIKPIHTAVIPGRGQKIQEKNQLDHSYETIREEILHLFAELNIAS